MGTRRSRRRGRHPHATASGGDSNLVTTLKTEPAYESSGDSTTDYLASIGRHPLLTGEEEAVLGLRVEAWVFLKNARAELTEAAGAPPDPLALVVHLYGRLASTRPAIVEMARLLGVSDRGLSVSDLLEEPSVHDLLNWRMNVAEKKALSEARSLPEGEMAVEVARVASLARLLPLGLVRDLENSTDLGDAEQEAVVSPRCMLHAREMMAGVEEDGRAAFDRLVRSNLRLVVSVARRYFGLGQPLLDLVQEGNLGLMKAVERFNPHRGFKFSTYATWWIRQGMTRSIADFGRTIRLPVHVVERVQRLTRAERELTANLDRDPTLVELSEELGWGESMIQELRLHRRLPMSLESPTGEDESALINFVSDAEAETVHTAAVKSLHRQDVMRAVDMLPARLATIIKLRFGLDDGRTRTLDEIGKVMGVTRERIRQLEQQALGRLRVSELVPGYEDRSHRVPRHFNDAA